MNDILGLVLSASLKCEGLSAMVTRPVLIDTHVKTIPPRLSALEVRIRMRSLSDWTTDGERLFYVRTFENFVESVAFVNSLVEPAEHLGHHPDITINYNQVSLELTTHDAHGLTDLDFQLARKISQL